MTTAWRGVLGSFTSKITHIISSKLRDDAKTLVTVHKIITQIRTNNKPLRRKVIIRHILGVIFSKTPKFDPLENYSIMKTSKNF